MSEENQNPDGIKEKLNAAMEKIGALTLVQRLLICVVTFAVIGGVFYWFLYKPKFEELKRLKKTYQARVQKMENFKKKASQIIKWEKKMAKKQEEFAIAMQALPDKRELPSLLIGISKSASDAGLNISLFQPEKEVNKEFYKEIPVSIKVTGRYHQLTDFFYQITRLNRIVNINNVDVKSKKNGTVLEMKCEAVTYMFVEKKKPKKGKKRRRRR